MRPVTAILIVFAAFGCHSGRPGTAPTAFPPALGAPRVAFALRQIDVSPGYGALAAPRKCFYVQYTGWLANGTRFDSSRDTTPAGVPRTPISFPQGFRRVISGWDLGFEGMRVGGRRRLLIPYQLGYGEAGRPPVIPPRSELIFDVELMAVADTVPRAEPVPGTPAASSPQCPSWGFVSGTR